MKEIRIFDTLFAHAEYSSDYQKSKYIKWNRNLKDQNFAIFTDNSLFSVDNENITNKIAWLLESPAITPYAYNWIRQNYDKFNQIWTHQEDLLKLNDKFKFLPVGGCWIKPEDQKIYDKSKNISLIASAKKQTLGQILRHQVYIDYKDLIDVFGRGYNPIEYKLTALKDYRYSVVIENIKKNFYFTEKLIDCFMTGTIPIYWGCPAIGDFFNLDGMIIFDKSKDLKEILKTFDQNYYISKIYAIKDNFERAKEYLLAEDYIGKKLI